MVSENNAQITNRKTLLILSLFCALLLSMSGALAAFNVTQLGVREEANVGSAVTALNSTIDFSSVTSGFYIDQTIDRLEKTYGTFTKIGRAADPVTHTVAVMGIAEARNNTDITDSTRLFEGGRFLAQNAGSGTIADGIGLAAGADNDGAGTFEWAEGVDARLANVGSGSRINTGAAVVGRIINFNTDTHMSAVAGLSTHVRNRLDTSSLGTVYGLEMGELAAWGSNGSVENSYGIYLDSSINLGNFTHYAIYTEPGAGNVSFGDRVAIGMAEARRALDVNGTIRASRNVRARNNLIANNDLRVFGQASFGKRNASATLDVNGSALVSQNLGVSQNVSADGSVITNELCLGGDCRDTWAPDTTKAGAGPYLYNDSENIYVNESVLNNTIEQIVDDNALWMDIDNALWPTPGTSRNVILNNGTLSAAQINTEFGSGSVRTRNGALGILDVSSNRLNGKTISIIAARRGTGIMAERSGFFAIARTHTESIGSGRGYAMFMPEGSGNAHFGNFDLTQNDVGGQLNVIPANRNKVGIIVEAGSRRPNADLQQWRNFAGETRLSVNADGDVSSEGTIRAHAFGGNSPISFVNDEGEEIVRFEENGTVYTDGPVHAPELCIDGECRTAWHDINESELNGTIQEHIDQIDLGPWEDVNGSIVPKNGSSNDVRLNGGTIFAGAFSSNSPLELQVDGETIIYVRDDNHKVGIGTTNPNNDLHVMDADGRSTIKSESIIDRAQVVTRGGGAQLRMISSELDEVDGYNAIESANNDFTANAPLFIRGPDASIGSTLTVQFNEFNVEANGSSALFVGADGQVGIGRTDPARALDVEGTIRASNNVVAQNRVRSPEVCIDGDCRTEWPTPVNTTINNTFVFNNEINNTINNTFVNVVNNTINNTFVEVYNNTINNTFVVNNITVVNTTTVLNTTIVFNNTFVLNSTTTNNVNNTIVINNTMIVNNTLVQNNTIVVNNVTVINNTIEVPSESVWEDTGSQLVPAANASNDVNVSEGTIFAGAFSSNSPLQLQTSGVTRIFVDDVAGNVGVGTLSPQAPLHVLGNTATYLDLESAGANAHTWRFNLTEIGSESYMRFGDVDGVSNIVTVHGDDGTVGINTLPFSGFSLSVGGNIFVTGSVVEASDRNFKEGVRDLDSGVELIDRLQPRTYKYTEDYIKTHPGTSDDLRYGFVAQEFEKVFPEYVMQTPAGYYMDSKPVVAALVSATQELDDRVDALEKGGISSTGTNAALLAQVDDLKRRVAELENKAPASVSEDATTEALVGVLMGSIDSLEAENAQLKAALCDLEPGLSICTE